MAPNPYSPPDPSPGDAPPPSMNRAPLTLAAIGAVLASLYWAALTLLIALGAATGTVSGTQLILPMVLVALYAWRGYQVYKANPAAVRSLLWLHGLGGLIALVQTFAASGAFAAFQGVKFVIHVFGIVTTIMAKKVVDEAIRGGQIPY